MSNIVETHIPNQDVELKVKNAIYPQTRDKNLPFNFFVACFAGARGSEKSYLSCQLVKSMYD